MDVKEKVIVVCTYYPGSHGRDRTTGTNRTSRSQGKILLLNAWTSNPPAKCTFCK